jgi:hypothetical protein
MDENRRMGERIRKMKSSYSATNWERSYRQNLYLKEKINQNAARYEKIGEPGNDLISEILFRRATRPNTAAG